MTFNLTLTIIGTDGQPVSNLRTDWVMATGSSGLWTNPQGQVLLQGLRDIDCPITVSFIYNGQAYSKTLQYDPLLEGQTVLWRFDFTPVLPAGVPWLSILGPLIVGTGILVASVR